MFNSYINSAEKIYEVGNKKIIAYSVQKNSGKTDVRLHVVDENDNISAPIEISRSKIFNVLEIVNYVNLDERRGINALKKIINARWFSFPRIAECTNVGFQRNKDNEILSYMGARCFDNMGGKLFKDEFSLLPKCKGNVTAVVSIINQFMKKKIKRQIILAHALSGALCGLIGKNIILSLIGQSSRGKTSILKLGASFFSQTDYNGTIFKWSATQNALVKRMDGLSGVNVLVDDTQLSKIKQFAPIIYSFENGQSIDRLVKGNELCESYHWSVSIGITAERSLLDTFNDLGAVARIIELTGYKDDLFDDVEEVDAIQNLYKNNYGVVGTTFVKYLLSCYGKENIENRINKEGQRLCKTYQERIADNNILKRHLQGDIAILVTTAALANNCLGFSFQIPLLRSALLALCEENYRTFEQNQFEYIVSHTIYQDILSIGRECVPEYERNNTIIIPSNIMKTILLKYAALLKVKSARIKEELATQGLLSERNGTYCWNHTFNGSDVTGYEIIIKEEK
nr:DUF927 domain-containing protein [uncultured Eisenbergiella sp.]